MAVTVLPATSNVPVALLHDGDVIRWEDRVAVVRICGSSAHHQQEGRVLVRQIAHQSALLGYTNRLNNWDELQTPVYEVGPHECVEVLIANTCGIA